MKVKYNRQRDNTMQSYSRLQCSPSILSDSRAGYVNKFHPVDLPQQNNKTTNTLTQYNRGNGNGKGKLN